MQKIITLLLLFGLFTIKAQVPILVKKLTGKSLYTFTEYKNKSYFISGFSELWVTDVSTANTQLVKSFSCDGIVAVHAGKMYIRSSSSLWISDGTNTGTIVLKDGFTNISSQFVKVGNQLFFKATIKSLVNVWETNEEWWVTDGTTAGTRMIKDVNPGDYGQDTNTRYVVFNNKLYFYGYTETGARDFWVTDGTEAGTFILSESDYLGAVLLDYDLIVYNNKIYFTFHNRTQGIELWVSDGTKTGTKILKDCDTRTNSFGLGYSSRPTAFSIVNNKLLFFAYNQNDNDGINKYLWSTDGTIANTVPIMKVNINGLSDFEGVVFKNKLYFNGIFPDFGKELCVTDGTAAGTSVVKDIATGVSSSNPRRILVANNKLIFYAYNATYGSELWVSDGSDAGTKLLKDIFPGTSSSESGNNYYTSGNKAYLVAKTASSNFQLIATDGTVPGTTIIAPASATVTTNPLGDGSWANTLNKTFDMLYFNANYTSEGQSLYKLGSPLLNTETILKSEPFKIYPNPMNTILNIENSGVEKIKQVTIYNSLGQEVLHKSNNLSSTVFLIDVEKLQSGIYLAEILSDNGRTVQKVIKN